MIGLGTAVEYVQALGLEHIAAYEDELLTYATGVMAQLPGIRLIGTAEHKTSIISFVVEGIHPHDIGSILDQEGVAIRAGHHCTQPVMQRYGVPATGRASFSIYNTKEDADQLAAAIQKVQAVFA